MSPYLALSGELAGLVAAVGATLFTALVLRNPRNPKWLKTELASQAASLCLVAVFAFAVASAMRGMTAIGFDVMVAAAITLSVIALAAASLWLAFGMGNRLRRADSGQSPFDLQPQNASRARRLPRNGFSHRRSHP